MKFDTAVEDNWERLGLIFRPNTKLRWSRTHAMLPTPVNIDGRQLIYYSGRNILNQSNIGCFEVELGEEPRVVQSYTSPLLEPGELGCFDDNGVSPSCAIELPGGEIAMYYIGWNPGSTTRVNLFGGLAISHNRGKSFSRWSKSPILERTRTDPYMNTAPWVVKAEDGFRMYYVSGFKWENKDSPRYNIKIAYSLDGYYWERPGDSVLEFLNENETALARPYVIKESGIWKMWVTSRVGEYSIGYAESIDGINWHRNDAKLGLRPNGTHEEQSMTEYSAVIPTQDQYYMFYNGDQYGKNGILLARHKF